MVENAFRNTVFRSRGIFENVKFVNNYYGLWVDDVPEVFLARCDFVRNRFALSVRAGKVISADTKISGNVYGLYLEAGGDFNGDKSMIKDNLESDVRKESDELAGSGKRVSRRSSTAASKDVSMTKSLSSPQAASMTTKPRKTNHLIQAIDSPFIAQAHYLPIYII